MRANPTVDSVFERIIALRLPIVALYGLVVPVAGLLAARIPTDASLDRLLVADDPATLATRAFQKVFPEAQIVILLLETQDPYGAPALAQARVVEDAVKATGVTVYSAQSVYRRAHPTFLPGAGPPGPPGAPGAPGSEEAQALADFRRFAEGAHQLQRQGLVGPGYLGLTVAFLPKGAAERDATLAAIDAAVDRVLAAAGPDSPIREVRRVGSPYVESWLERASHDASETAFPLFGLFVVALTLFLYRSLRALLAILSSLGVAVVLALGVGHLLGFVFTLVSSLVPLTVMVTTLANLVYVHSRYVDQPEDRTTRAHQVFALGNKLLPVTASNIAAILGFAALAVSDIRPIFEMGMWTAIGLAFGWLVTFTLFPALQHLLHVPTGRTVPIRSHLYDVLAEGLPSFTRRWRRPLVFGALAGAAAGLVALFGVPGRIAPMRISIDPMDYVDPDSRLYKDMLFFRDHVSGLNVARLWVQLGEGASVTDGPVLQGLDRFATSVEALPDVSSVVGPTTLLRMRRYLAGGGDTLPDDPAVFASLGGDLEQLLLSEPELRAFVDVGTMAQAQMMVTFRRNDDDGATALTQGVGAAWQAAVAHNPGLRGSELRIVGEYLLQAKAGASLVPTLAESFAITAVLIFLAFFAVFRSATARLMAIIPSLFAILVTFLGMRLLGAGLNVATILIATTVLGTTENDQIHFFYHLQEGEGDGLEPALRHSIRVSGRTIAFATLINAAGFMGLAFTSFPPMRQFGVVAAAAFGLAMLADFTALPGALWMLRGRHEPPTETAADRRRRAP